MTITIVDIIPGHPGRRMKIMCLGSRAQMKMDQFITLMFALQALALVVAIAMVAATTTTALVVVAIIALAVVAAVLAVEAHAPVVVVGRVVEAHAQVAVALVRVVEAHAQVVAAVRVAEAHAQVVVVLVRVAEALALVAHARPELAQVVAAGQAVPPVGRVKERKGNKKNALTPHALEHPACQKCLKTNAKR